MKSLILTIALLSLSFMASGVPREVEILAEKMIHRGARVRAAYTDELGVYVVGIGVADIGESRAGARIVARETAVKAIAEYLGKEVSASDKTSVKMLDANGERQTEKFFSSIVSINVKQTLKGVQDLCVEEIEGRYRAVVYLTTKSSDKSAQLKSAMAATGDVGTVEAIGEASNHDAALQKALRSAVEQVVGTMVLSETATKDIEKVKSKIFSGAAGFVDEYRITSETQVSIGTRIVVLAKVSKKKLLDSYSVYMKALGSPTFYLHSNSGELDSRFVRFFNDLGLQMSATPEGATYWIEAHGDFRDRKHPASGKTITQLSMTIRIRTVDGTDYFVAVENDPRKSVSKLSDPDRRREDSADKAFAQMKEPVHNEIQKMVAKLMERHTDTLMNQDE